jgi:hypothetical protein
MQRIMNTRLEEVIDWRVIGGELRPVRVMVKVEVKVGQPKGKYKGKPGKKWTEIYSPEDLAKQLEFAKSKIPLMKQNSIAARKGKPAVNSKPVLMIDPKTGNIIGRFYSSREAMRATGVDQRCIRKVATGHRETSGGYKWRFENE